MGRAAIRRGRSSRRRCGRGGASGRGGATGGTGSRRARIAALDGAASTQSSATSRASGGWKRNVGRRSPASPSQIDARLEEVPAAEADGVAPLGDREARAAQDILDIQHAVGRRREARTGCGGWRRAAPARAAPPWSAPRSWSRHARPPAPRRRGTAAPARTTRGTTPSAPRTARRRRRTPCRRARSTPRARASPRACVRPRCSARPGDRAGRGSPSPPGCAAVASGVGRAARSPASVGHFRRRSSISVGSGRTGSRRRADRATPRGGTAR